MQAATRASGQSVPAERARSDWVSVANRWVRERRVSDVAFALLALLAFVVLFYLGRHLTFYADEWEFLIKRHDLTLQNLLEPHNEHWSLFPVLAYRGLYGIFGLHSYLPYFALLLLVHVTAVTGLFVLLRVAAGPLVALGGATLMLFLGTAFRDLFWAFQIGFIGSVAAGLWAIVIVQRSVDARARAAVGGLLFVAVASSGIGLFFVVAVGTIALLDPARRRALQPVVAVALVYLVWFMVYGRTGLDTSHNPISLAALAGIPRIVIIGGGTGIGGLLGVDLPENQALFVLLMGAVAWGVIRGRPDHHLATAAVVGLVAQFVLIGLARDQVFLNIAIAANNARYVYPSGVFLLLALAAFLGEPAKRSVSWQQGVAVALVVGFCLIGNVTALYTGSRAFQGLADQLRASIAWLQAHPGSPLVRADVPPTRDTPVGASEIIALADRAGIVTRDDLLPRINRPIRPLVSDQALFGMAKAAFKVTPAGGAGLTAAPPAIADSRDVAAAPQGGCLSLRATGPAPQLSIVAPAGASFLFVPEVSGTLRASLGMLARPQHVDSIYVEVIGGQRYAIAIPDVGAGVPWTLSVVPPADPGGGQLCGLSPGL